MDIVLNVAVVCSWGLKEQQLTNNWICITVPEATQKDVTPALVLRRDHNGYLEMEPQWRSFPFGKANPRLDVSEHHSFPDNSLGACLAEWFGNGRFRFEEYQAFFSVLQRIGIRRKTISVGERSYLLLTIASQLEILIDESAKKIHGIFHKADRLLSYSVACFVPEGSHNELFLRGQHKMVGVPLFIGHPCFEQYLMANPGLNPESLADIVDRALVFRAPRDSGNREQHALLCNDGKVRLFQIELPEGMSFDASQLSPEDIIRMSSLRQGNSITVNLPAKRTSVFRW